MMEKTPLSNRRHVAIFGSANTGKSTLFNEILGQDAAIVSDVKGTTTDPVIRAMELLPFGPIALIDTAGLDDDTQLGALRTQKSEKIFARTDYAVYLYDSEDKYQKFAERNIPHVLVFSKADKISDLQQLKVKYPDALFVSMYDEKSIEALKLKICNALSKLPVYSDTMIGDIVKRGGTAIGVMPIDSEAPAGRIILPQVQFIRDCLDHGIRCIAVQPDMLADTIRDTKEIDIVVTDSQAFKQVSEIVPRNIRLTSFSILLSRQKGNFEQQLEGIKGISKLCHGDKILVAEGCTHNRTHEDIGHFKIPALLKKSAGKNLSFDFVNGYDFPDDIKNYAMVIQCGGCMINKKAIEHRLEVCKENNVPITNYGIILAHFNGILERSIKL